MGVVFVVLVILSIVIWLLGRLDQRTENQVAATAESAPVPGASASSGGVSPEIVAVIGAALALAQAEDGPRPAARRPAQGEPSDGAQAGDWTVSGLARQMASRTRESIRRGR